SYRARYLPAMTPRRIAALPDKPWAPVIIVTGAIEQHGPHLPVAVDSFLGQVWLEAALPRLAADVPCYVAPPITVGKSNEHTGFPGTLSISRDTLRGLLWAQARQLAAWGFRHLAILNTHGGNLAVITYTLREISAALDLRCGLLAPRVDHGLSAQEMTYGYHANTVETALMQATAGNLVEMSLAVREYCGEAGSPGNLRPERAPATMAWITSDLSRSGVMGDAPAGTEEKGRRWHDQMAAAYAAAITELARAARAGAGPAGAPG
ncbi:MAG: creatininase family protein, partial [Verrucomicrobiota bacterium]